MSRRVMRGFDPAALRAARGTLPVVELARLARVGRNTIQMWEAGRSSPQVDILARVCEVLGIDIADVVRIEPDETYPADLRILAGLTQPLLGKKAGLSTAAIGMIERAEVELTESSLRALAMALGVERRQYREAFERARTRPAGTPA